MENRRTLTATKGYIYTDGTNFGYVIELEVGVDFTKWHQITEQEYAEILKAREIENEEEI